MGTDVAGSIGDGGALSRLLIRQDQFDAWADSTKSRSLVALGVAMLLLAVCCATAIAIMGPRLAREGALLWFGARTEGTVRETKLEEVGKFKDGAPKYRLVIDYSVVAANGSRHEGSTTRTDVRTPPDLSAGDSIGVYYAPANPANSVAEHNLRIDVYALALFLPFLGFMGIGWPLFWAYRFSRWRRQRRAASA
jgi:hypothetical protein